MAQKSLDTLQHEIDAAVHPTGGPPKVQGPALNAVLSSLASEVVAAGGPLQIVDYNWAINSLENKYFDTGELSTYPFAVGDLVTVNGQGLYQCVQAFTVGYDGDNEQFVNSHYPTSSPAYWRVALQPGSQLFVGRDELDYKVARFGTGPNSTIVASPNLPQVSTGWASAILGGQNNTAAAETGAVVGGYNLTLPEGATSSVVLGGHDYTAPARLDTVFAPKLVLWQNGSTVELTDLSGNAHVLGVGNDGILLLNGLPLETSNSPVPVVPLMDEQGNHYSLTVNTDGTLRLNGRPLDVSATPSLVLIASNNNTHVLTATPAGVLTLNGQPVVPESVSALLLLDPNGQPRRLAATPNGTLTLDGRPVAPPLLTYTAQTAGFVAADPETHVLPLLNFYSYQQPDYLPVPQVNPDGSYTVPVRGYYEVITRVQVEGGVLSPTDSYGIGGGPVLDGSYQVWADGSAAPRYLTSYNAQRMVLEAGTSVFLFVQFPTVPAKASGYLTVYLLHEL
jgi:hypothetical protein